jgi:hypothetical protein
VLAKDRHKVRVRVRALSPAVVLREEERTQTPGDPSALLRCETGRNGWEIKEKEGRNRNGFSLGEVHVIFKTAL